MWRIRFGPRSIGLRLDLGVAAVVVLSASATAASPSLNPASARTVTPAGSGPTLVANPKHGLAKASVTLTFTETSCTPGAPINFQWSGEYLTTMAMTSTCSVSVTVLPPGDKSQPGNYQLQAGENPNSTNPTGTWAYTSYTIDSVMVYVNPPSAAVATQLHLGYQFNSSTCPGTAVKFNLDSVNGLEIARSNLSSGMCAADVSLTVPSVASPGQHSIWGTLLNSANDQIPGTSASAGFVVLASGSSGSGGGPTHSPGPTSSSGSGSGSTSGAGSSSGSGGGTSAGSSSPGPNGGSSPKSSGSANASSAPVNVATVDLSGSMLLGSVDPVGSFVSGGSDQLWPYLIVVDAFALYGCLIVTRRWRRRLDDES